MDSDMASVHIRSLCIKHSDRMRSNDLVYTYPVLNYSYIRNGSTTITLHDNIGLVSDMAYPMIDSYIVVQCNSGAAIPSNSRQDMYNTRL